MGVAMGDSGIVNGGSTVRQWQVDYLEDDRPYAATNTGMGTDRNCGIIDWTGQYFAYGGAPASFPGDALTFLGEGVTTDGASGTAIVERIQVAWEQENADYCQHILHFAGNGDLTLGAIAVQSDATIPNPYCGAGLAVKMDSSTIADVRRAYLDIRRMYGKPPGQVGNRPYSSSSVPGKTRRIKSRLDWSMYFDMYVATYAALNAQITLQASNVWSLYVNATQYWELTWGRVVKLEKLGADVEGSELLGVRVHVAMKGSNGSSLGTVKAPGGAVKWPG